MNETTAREESGQQPEESIQPALVPPGTQLAARRQELSLSIAQVANQLNLAPRQIEAIEADNYGALPGMAIVRGFIRSYAKLLKLDATPLLLLIANEAPPSSDPLPLRRALPSTSFSGSRLEPMDQRRMPSKAAIAVLALVVLIAGAFAAQRMGWLSIFPESLSVKVDKGLTLLSHASVPAAASAEVTVPANSAGAANPGSVIAGSAASVGAATGTPGKPDTVTGSMIVEPVATNVAVQALTPTVAANGPAAANPTAAPEASAIAAKDALVLKVREDSWIEIRRADNSTMISRLVKAGSAEAFRITGPVSLTVGNAAGVDATLRGKPIELQADSKSNVARLDLK